MKSRYSCLACDLGGTHLRLGLGDESGAVHRVRKAKVRNFRDGHAPGVIADLLTDDIAVYHREVADLLPVDAPLVVAFPGPVEGRRRILAAPTLMGNTAELPDLHGRLTAALGRMVYIINDVSAAAWYLSTFLDADRFLVVTVSSGIGSKVFDRHHPLGVLDDRSYAGELGHLVFDIGDDAPWCDCGGRGHLGAVASGRGYELTARRQAHADPTSFRASACSRLFRVTADTLTNEDLVRAAYDGDTWSLEVIRRGCRFLAQSLLAAVLATGIERVIVIGGFALALGPVYLEILREEMRRGSSCGPLAPDPADLVMLGEPGEEACLRGAVVYAVQQARARQ